ncbi:hypothetical protein HF888_00575 [Bermanella marisrubri]|uniref:Orphan protein n=1 Tax=Bermanella marisrubri TaxID=207949 RepID=Q1N403_9GAMM|nr:hypothetical protein [Bermanella marisrubri]EAT13062.1 hypothetical protein RED65_15237 [Oceanobacter sp. RED65] [Bermanella marisrubri]QIZ82821.1 hypothetical protein HF888_00575 [Bermanella marisrubri]
MRAIKLVICHFILVISFDSLAASQRTVIEDLSAQVSPLWQDIHSACLLAMQPQMQYRVSERLQFAKQNFTASRVADGILANLNNPPAVPWQAKSWGIRKRLEASALETNQRDKLREYYFKLQTQTPTETRLELVNMIVDPILRVNLALHEGLWKSCYSLNLTGLDNEQLQLSIDQRWQAQKQEVRKALYNELSAFYFFAFRQIDNTQLNILAKDSAAYRAWFEAASTAVNQYFTRLHASLLAVALLEPTKPRADEPFLEGPLGNPAPSPKLLEP